MDYVVDEEFSGLHRSLTQLELEQLEANCVADGSIRDPIVVWGQYILDGRHRLSIARKHGIPYNIHEADFKTRDEAKDWVVCNQLGKRNLSDQDMQRLRVEHARLNGTRATADMSGVDIRTVQRDVEAAEAIDMMPEDIAEKVKRGSVISNRRALKKYKELDEDQRSAVDQKIREQPDITLQEAIPEKRTTLEKEDFDLINECPHLSGKQKRSIALGSIHATRSGVRDFMALKPEDQVTASELLEDPEIDSLDDAVRTFKISKRPLAIDDQKKVDKLKAKATTACELILKTLGDIRALKTDKSGYAPCIEATKALMEQIESWR